MGSATYPNGIVPAATPLTVAAFTHVDQDTLATVTMAHPTPAGPAGAPTYAWTWKERPTGAAATFSNVAIAQPTVTPDAAGGWVAVCSVTVAGQTVQFVHSFSIGIEIAPGLFAQVLVDLDLPTIGAAAPQDLTALGNADYVVGGVTLYCDVSGTVSINLNASGIQIANPAGAGEWGAVTLGVSDDYDVDPGDLVIVQWSWTVASMNAGAKIRLCTSFAQGGAATGAGQSNKIEMLCVNAGDYDCYGRAGTGATIFLNHLAAALPATLQAFILGRDVTCEAGMDLDATMPTPRNTTPQIALAGSLSQAQQVWASGRYSQWAGALHAIAMVWEQPADASLTRIRLLRARPITYV